MSMRKPQTNFWIASASMCEGILCLKGHNRDHEQFEVLAGQYVLKGPVDFDNEEWDEGSFLVWDGNELWQIKTTLSTTDSSTEYEMEVIPDDEFHYHEFGLSPIVFSQITGAIVANL